MALDKRYLDPRRTVNPSQAEREEGIIPLTESLPIIPQVRYDAKPSLIDIFEAGLKLYKTLELAKPQ